MPGDDGFVLTRRLRATSNVGIIIVTGKGAAGERGAPAGDLYVQVQVADVPTGLVAGDVLGIHRIGIGGGPDLGVEALDGDLVPRTP